MLKFANTYWPTQRILATCYDSITIVLSLILSITLKFGSLKSFFVIMSQNDYSLGQAINYILIISIVQFVTFYSLGLNKSIWRYSSFNDLYLIFKGVSLGTVFSVLGIFLWDRAAFIPRSIFIIDWFILMVSIGLGRFLGRFLSNKKQKKKGARKALLIGVEKNGEKLIREVQSNKSINFNIVAILDSNPALKKTTIHGVEIVGLIDELEKYINKYHPDEILISSDALNGKKITEINKICSKNNIEVLVLPETKYRLEYSSLVKNLRKITYEDLLQRDVINFNTDFIKSMITNKTILITGAGGSIGSELTTQICSFKPKKVIIFERSEYAIYKLIHLLKSNFAELEFSYSYNKNNKSTVPNSILIIPIIGDILDKELLTNIFITHKIDIVFHAAAYKHVTLMEENPYSAVRNNIVGTENLLKILSKQNTVEKFVLISSDKAVNPSNVMGLTKKVAELLCHKYYYSQKYPGKISFITVRFGNVIGSSGSVIPLFEKQIREGGPVTITHPEVKRYFMSISEACLLVLKSATIGEGSETYILDMGKQIKMTDLAKNLINLYQISENIEIKYTGLRKGEKIEEELFSVKEKLIKTNFKGIKKVYKTAFFNLSLEYENAISKIKPEMSDTDIFELIDQAIVNSEFRDNNYQLKNQHISIS